MVPSTGAPFHHTKDSIPYQGIQGEEGIGDGSQHWRHFSPYEVFHTRVFKERRGYGMVASTGATFYPTKYSISYQGVQREEGIGDDFQHWRHFLQYEVQYFIPRVFKERRG